MILTSISLTVVCFLTETIIIHKLKYIYKDIYIYFCKCNSKLKHIYTHFIIGVLLNFINVLMLPLIKYINKKKLSV